MVTLLVAACGDGSGTADQAQPTTTTGADSQAPTTTVAEVVDSPDRSATLEIPAGALPAGVDPSEITIEPIDVDPSDPVVAALLEAGFTPGPAYRFGPEGLVFEVPALLRITSPTGDRFLTAFIVGEDSIEPLEVDEEATVAQEGIVFAVPHFSTVETYFGPFFAILRAPSEAVVNVPFVVRSEVFIRAATLEVDRFSLKGTLVADHPVSPEFTEAPPPTEVIHPAHTSSYLLVCTVEGTTSLLGHFLFVSVERSVLSDSGIALAADAGAAVGDESGNVALARHLDTWVDCLAAGAETAESGVAGVYSGSLSFTAVPGMPGGDYRDDFDLVLQDCGLATLTQRSTQVSLGRFFSAPDDFFTLYAFGSGDDYAEVYEVTVHVAGSETILVEGVTVGGGHGLGEVFDEDSLAWAAFAVWDVQHGTLDKIGVAWFNEVEGLLTRTGDAPPCD